jgi:hypothetical protein
MTVSMKLRFFFLGGAIVCYGVVNFSLAIVDPLAPTVFDFTRDLLAFSSSSLILGEPSSLCGLLLNSLSAASRLLSWFYCIDFIRPIFRSLPLLLISSMISYPPVTMRGLFIVLASSVPGNTWPYLVSLMPLMSPSF